MSQNFKQCLDTFDIVQNLKVILITRTKPLSGLTGILVSLLCCLYCMIILGEMVVLVQMECYLCTGQYCCLWWRWRGGVLP